MQAPVAARGEAERGKGGWYGRYVLLYPTNYTYISRRDVREERKALTIFCPFVFSSDSGLLLWREIVDDVESFPDLLWRLSSYHFSDDLASCIKQRLDV